MAVVFNQGILITGKSGIGKSQLLLSLIDRGHMWIADELTELKSMADDRIIGSANKTLPSYIHIKGIGAIDMDKTYGLATRLTQHPVAAIVQLSSDCHLEQLSFLNQQENVMVLNKTLPSWKIPSDSPNKALLVETCARQIILNEWGINAADELDAQLTFKIQNTQSRIM